MLSLLMESSGSLFSRSAMDLPIAAKWGWGRSINQLYLVQPESSGCLKAVLLSRRATALSVCWLPKNDFIRGGNHAIGAPSGVRGLRAAKRAVASLACRSRLAAFVISFFEPSILLRTCWISLYVALRIFCNGPRKKVK